MKTRSEIIAAVEGWMSRFEVRLEAWEDWLLLVERAYLSNEVAQIATLDSSGCAIRDQIFEAHRERDDLLVEARELGFSGISITSMVRWLGSDSMADWQSRLSQLSQQLRRTQQLGTAMWLTGFQAYGYTSSLIDLLATGSAGKATYSDCERSCLEGGHLVDAAA